MIEQLDSRTMLINYFNSSDIIRYCVEQIGETTVDDYCQKSLNGFINSKAKSSALEVLHELEISCVHALHEHRLKD